MLKIIFAIFVLAGLAEPSALINSTLPRLKRQSLSCGVPSIQQSGLIFNGDSFEKGSWPWIVALVSRETSPSKFFCAGTLISRTKVITAAHCVHQKSISLQKRPRDVIIVFGAHDLTELFHPGTYTAATYKIILHDDWNPFVKSFDADIAMLMTEEEIPITNSIKPICLWDNSIDPSESEGFIAGWGLDTLGEYGRVPKQLKTPIFDNGECLLDNPFFTKIASKRTFCGGSRTDKGPCLGDSGSGLVIKHQGVFFLRGIVSSSLLDENGKCDVTNYALYTNVLKYSSWIRDQDSKEPLPLAPPLPPPQVSKTSLKTCGIMTDATSLIQGGSIAPKTLFPWAVLVYSTRNGRETPNYLKTGTLVSDKHVLVPGAFLLHSLPSQFFVVRDVSRSEVESFTFHPDFKDGNPKEKNIALIVMSASLLYATPVCLWPQKVGHQEILGESGYAFGWGYDEKATYTDEKKYLKATVKICGNYHQLASQYDNKYFCIYPETKGTPCVSDDPFYIKSGDRWYVRGLWARGYLEKNLTCNVDKPTQYEDMASVTSWIQNIIDG